MAAPSVHPVDIGSVRFGNTPLPSLIAGLCVIDTLENALHTARRLKEIADATGFALVFKASYDKANRTSLGGFRGPGLEAGLEILAEVKSKFGLPILTDVHRDQDIAAVAAVADCLQIPAFLCRQTDFVQAVARAGKPVNVKKGQFMAPDDMKRVIEKIAATGNEQITLTERGASFGYHNLVVDMRSLVIMRETGFPVVFDATHSVQLPSGSGSASGGDRKFVPALSRAAVAVGVDGLFFETHECPEKALCDGPNSLALDDFGGLLKELKAIALAMQGNKI